MSKLTSVLNDCNVYGYDRFCVLVVSLHVYASTFSCVLFVILQVFFSSIRSGSSGQIYFMTLNKPGLANW